MSRATQCWLTAVGVLVVLAGLAPGASAVPGDLDPTFSRDGYLRLDLGRVSIGDAVAVDDRSRLVVAATRDLGGDRKLSIARFNIDGSLDRTFGRKGIASLDFDLGPGGGGRTIEVLADGRIVASALTAGGYAVVRLTAEGSLDTTFDGDGVATVDFGFPVALADAEVATDGSVVLAGSTGSSSGVESLIFVARLTASGALDPSFSGDGKTAFAFADGNGSTAAGLELTGAGMLVGGTRYRVDSLSSDFALARLRNDGELDPSFSDDGTLAIERPSGQVARDMQIDPSGRILFGGCCSPGLVRLDRDAGVDPTFSLGPQRSALVHADMFGFDSAARIVTAEDTGGCDSRYCSSPDFLVARRLPDGPADTTFAGGGFRNQDFAKHDEYVRDLTILPDDRIAVTGQSARDLMLALYESRPGPADADGDRRRDDRDRCASRYSRSRDGCPTFNRKLTFVRSETRDLFSGRLTAREDKCVNNRHVEVRRVEPGFDRILKTVDTDPLGHWQMDASLTPGTYYALVDADFSKPVGKCGAAKSNEVTIR